METAECTLRHMHERELRRALDASPCNGGEEQLARVRRAASSGVPREFTAGNCAPAGSSRAVDSVLGITTPAVLRSLLPSLAVLSSSTFSCRGFFPDGDVPRASRRRADARAVRASKRKASFLPFDNIYRDDLGRRRRIEDGVAFRNSTPKRPVSRHAFRR